MIDYNNHVYKIRISVSDEIQHDVYNRNPISEEFAEKYVKKNYDKYYRQLIADKILSGEIKLEYYCNDTDGGYEVDENDILNLEDEHYRSRFENFA